MVSGHLTVITMMAWFLFCHDESLFFALWMCCRYRIVIVLPRSVVGTLAKGLSCC